MLVSIIIPVLNETPHLERLLPDLPERCPGAEIIVVDGGSADGTPQVVDRFAFARLLSSPRGRATQMNVGAAQAQGEVLCFLHADTVLPHGALDAVRSALADPRMVGGRFDINIDSPRVALQVITFFMNLRSRLTRIATGDQAIFVRRKIFLQMGGFPDIPLMEDVEFTKRLKRQGRVACLPVRVTTSARKWEREGVIRTILLMWTLRLLYFFGISPARLLRLYYGYPPSTA